MRHPLVVHQAKWLLLGLLKTTASALATTTAATTGTAGGLATAATTNNKPCSYHTMLFSSSSSAAAVTTPPPFPHHHRNHNLHLQPQPPPTTEQPHPSLEPSTMEASSSSSSLQPPQPVPLLLQLRLARASDVAHIAACNRHALPENYHDDFYRHHIAEWPDLAIVAELLVSPVPDGEAENADPNANDDGGPAPYPRGAPHTPLHSNYQPETSHQPNNNSNNHPRSARHFRNRFSFLPAPKSAAATAANVATTDAASSTVVVAYLLGKVCPQQPQYMHHQQQQRQPHQPSGIRGLVAPPEMVGHVSSLAVLSHVRRRGLAAAMLRQFHAHLRRRHPPPFGGGDGEAGVASTGLHVRCSNTAAVRLYEKLGYTPAVCIPAYYEDGEDAYYMQKLLRRRRQCVGDDDDADDNDALQWALPRVVGALQPPRPPRDKLHPQHHHHHHHPHDDENDDDDVPELLRLSGSM